MLSDLLAGSRATRTLLGSQKEWRLWLAPALITSHFVNDPCLHVGFIRAGFTSSTPTEELTNPATGLLGTRAVCPDSRPNPYVFSITIFPFWRGGWAGLSVSSRLNASLVLTPPSHLLNLSSLCAHPHHHHLLIPSFIHQIFSIFAGVSHYHHGFLNGILSW